MQKLDMWSKNSRKHTCIKMEIECKNWRKQDGTEDWKKIQIDLKTRKMGVKTALIVTWIAILIITVKNCA